MDMGRFLIETHLRTAADQGAGPDPRGERRAGCSSCSPATAWRSRPGSSPGAGGPSLPTRIADLYEDEIVALRKELADAGFDAGAPPSTSTWASATATPVGPHHLAGAAGPGLCHPPAPEAARRAPSPVSWPTCPTSAGRPT